MFFSPTQQQQDGVFQLYHLRSDHYDRITCSELPALQDLDLELLSRCVLLAQTNYAEAVRTFRREIQK